MDPAAPSPRLVELAHAHGVATEYWDWQGQHVTVTAPAITAVLTALGVDSDGDEQVERALTEVDLAPWRRTLPATVVAREGWTPWVFAHVPAGTGIRLTVHLEDGSVREVRQVDRWVPDRDVDGVAVGEATFELPGDLPLGWHRIVADVDAAPMDPRSVDATLVVTPHRLELPPALARGRAVGLMAQLYQVRSAGSWGVGDLGDLAELAAWAATEHDADFVLINPLHAAQPVAPMEPSPYLPTTRRFVNPLYLRVADVPETADLDDAASAKVAAFGAVATALNSVDRINRDDAWAAKREALWIVFSAGRTAERDQAFAEFCAREGSGLTTFATWCAIADDHGLPWTTWPEELQDPDSVAVALYREDHLEAENVISGNAIFQASGSARIGRDIPADAAILEAGRIRRIRQIFLAGSGLQFPCDHARLDHGHKILWMDFKNPVHPVQREDNTFVDRGASADIAISGSARGYRDSCPAGLAEHEGNLLRGGWQNDEVGLGLSEPFVTGELG